LPEPAFWQPHLQLDPGQRVQPQLLVFSLFMMSLQLVWDCVNSEQSLAAHRELRLDKPADLKGMVDSISVRREGTG
jgi:hypothetical protein